MPCSGGFFGQTGPVIARRVGPSELSPFAFTSGIHWQHACHVLGTFFEAFAVELEARICGFTSIDAVKHEFVNQRSTVALVGNRSVHLGELTTIVRLLRHRDLGDFALGTVGDVSTDHPNIARNTGRSDVHPVNTVEGDPLAVEIATCAGSSRIGSTAGIVEHHPNVLGRIDGHRLREFKFNEVFSTTREANVHLTNCASRSVGTIVVDGNSTIHRIATIISGDLGHHVALV